MIAVMMAVSSSVSWISGRTSFLSMSPASAMRRSQ